MKCLKRSAVCADNSFTTQSPSRAALRMLLFFAALMVLLALSMLLGPSGIGIPDMDSPSGSAILSLRFSRLLMGMMTGAALSASGVVFQALLRNPLAEPYAVSYTHLTLPTKRIV